MESSGGPNVMVVAPGSSDDPFSNNNPENNPDANLIAPTTSSAPPASQPGSQPVSAPTQAPDGQQQVPVTPSTPAAPSQPSVDEIIAERLRQAQSGWDKRINTLQAQIRDQEAAHLKQVRDLQLEQVPEHQRPQLKQQWELEDAQTALRNKETALTDYHKAVEGLRLLQTYGAFGLTEDDLLACETVESMESLAKDKKLAFFENGGSVPGAKPATQNGGSSAPAGASASSDVGSNPSSPATPALLTTPGIESMAANIKTLFNTGPARPW